MTPPKQDRSAVLFILVFSAMLAGCSAPLLLLPGGALEGSTVEAPAEWSLMEEIDVVQLETNPAEPYSVNVWVIPVDQNLYVHSGTTRTTWIENMEADARVRLKANDSIYELVASRVETQDEFDRFIAAYLNKYEKYPRDPVIREVYLYRLTAPGAAM